MATFFFDIKDIDIKLCGPKSVIGRSVVLSSKPEVMDLSENESNSKKKKYGHCPRMW